MKDLTLHSKGGERTLENMMESVLIVTKKNCVLHILVVKSLMKMIFKNKNLEDIWWHEECMPNVYIYKKNNHMRDRERKTKKYKTKFTRTDGITRREALISHFQNHESLQVALWPTSRARPPQPTQGLVPAGQAPSGP
jgi:hypothetical protein